MTSYTKAEKFKANKGVQKFIVELLATSPHGPKTRGQLFTEILSTFPLADVATVGNALSVLKRKGKIVRLPSSKDRRGCRWTIKGESAAETYLPKEDKALSPVEVGTAIITAIINMKKRLGEQIEAIDYLKKTLRNKGDVWHRKKEELEARIVDQNNVIVSLQMQLEPDPELKFKLADIANFSLKQEGG